MSKLSRVSLERKNAPISEGGKSALSRRVGVVFAAALTVAVAKTMTKGTRRSRGEMRRGLGQSPRRGGSGKVVGFGARGKLPPT